MVKHRDFVQRLNQACDRSPDVPEKGRGQQTWLADRLGISQEAVRRYFEGQSRPRPSLMVRLAKILNVDEAWLALGTAAEMTEKQRRQYSQKAEASAYMAFGIFMAAGYSCAFDENDDSGVDFYAIRSGKQTAVSVTTAYAKSKNVYVVPVRESIMIRLNLCVIAPETGSPDILVMDDDGVKEFGEAKTDNIHVLVKKDRQGYHSNGRLWTQLKDSEVLTRTPVPA